MDNLDFADMAYEQEMEHEMRLLERIYFPNKTPVRSLDVCSLPGPACLTPEGVIQINQSVAAYPKMRAIIILHELIHHNLRVLGNDDDPGEGERFQNEVVRLWNEGAYKGLL